MRDPVPRLFRYLTVSAYTSRDSCQTVDTLPSLYDDIDTTPYEEACQPRNPIFDGFEVALTGDISLAGVCADAPAEAQLLYTLFQYRAVNSVTIRIDGRNLKQMLDASGAIADHEPYRRDELDL